jgi:hypothetical protein
MAKKQTRRSVSLSQSTYERLKSYCETNELSMSEFVESRIGDFLGRRQVDRATPHTNPAFVEPAQPKRVIGGGGIFTF